MLKKYLVNIRKNIVYILKLVFIMTTMEESIWELVETLNTTIKTPESTPKNCTEVYDDSAYNITLYIDPIEEQQAKNIAIVRFYLYGILLPIVCVFGFFGNILNIAIFTKKKTCKTLDEIEYCTTICLVALAASDMMFCVCAFPQTFGSKTEYYSRHEFMLYYRMYASSAINTFILSSTMLTVLTAIMRYTAICHPFYCRRFISLKKTIVAIFAVYIFSLVFNLPYLWRYKTEECLGPGPATYIQLLKGDIFNDDSFVYTQKLLWAILGNFIPLAILLYCNVRLVKALHQSQKLRLLHSRDNVGCLSAHKRVNITLITIIIFFFILVAPSEISKFIIYISKSNNSQTRYTYHMVSLVTNALQCINFSVNFILYYVIIAPFRRTLHEFICVLRIGRRGTRDSTNSQKQQTCVLLTVKDQRRNLL